MKPKTHRLILVLISFACLAGAFVLINSQLREQLIFFYMPEDLIKTPPPPKRIIRIGGMVVEGSIKKLEDHLTTAFVVTDTKHTIEVRYTGLLPNMFREKQGVVAKGVLGRDGIFIASELLTKHDEKYMPPELAKRLPHQMKTLKE